MRRLAGFWIALFCLVPGLAFAEPGPAGVTMTATLERPVCPEGQAVMLAIVLHNAGATVRLIGYGAFESSSFHLTVADSKGRMMPHTALGEQISTPPSAVYANPSIELKPGETLRYRFNLARLFDLSRAGQYEIRADRYIFRGSVPSSEAEHLIASPMALRLLEDTSAKSGAASSAPPRVRGALLYLANQDDAQGLFAYRIEPDGTLSDNVAFTPTWSCATPQRAGALVATPDGRFLYACNIFQKTIAEFRIGADGKVAPLESAGVPALQYTSFLVMDPHGRFLWALGSFGDTRYAIGNDGHLTVAESVPKEMWASDPGHHLMPTDSAVIDTAGTLLFTCGAMPQGYRLGADGRVTGVAAPAAIDIPGSHPYQVTRAIALSPSGKYLFTLVEPTGRGNDDVVVPLGVGADGTLTDTGGRLKPMDQSGYPDGPTAATLAVDPTGRFLLVSNVTFIARYRIESNGGLTALGMTRPPNAAFRPLMSVVFAPNGKVYALGECPFASALAEYVLSDQGDLIRTTPDPRLAGDLFAGAYVSGVPMTAPDPGPVTDGLAFSAGVLHGRHAASLPTVLRVVLKNVSAHPIPVGDAMTRFTLKVIGPPRRESFDQNGKRVIATSAVRLLAAGHDLFDASKTWERIALLPPGGERVYQFVVSRLTDLSLDGRYTMQMGYRLPGGRAASSAIVPVLLETRPFAEVAVRGDQWSVE